MLSFLRQPTMNVPIRWALFAPPNGQCLQFTIRYKPKFYYLIPWMSFLFFSHPHFIHNSSWVYAWKKKPTHIFPSCKWAVAKKSWTIEWIMCSSSGRIPKRKYIYKQGENDNNIQNYYFFYLSYLRHCRSSTDIGQQPNWVWPLSVEQTTST